MRSLKFEIQYFVMFDLALLYLISDEKWTLSLSLFLKMKAAIGM